MNNFFHSTENKFSSSSKRVEIININEEGSIDREYIDYSGGDEKEYGKEEIEIYRKQLYENQAQIMELNNTIRIMRARQQQTEKELLEIKAGEADGEIKPFFHNVDYACCENSVSSSSGRWILEVWLYAFPKNNGTERQKEIKIYPLGDNPISHLHRVIPTNTYNFVIENSEGETVASAYGKGGMEKGRPIVTIEYIRDINGENIMAEDLELPILFKTTL